MISLSSHLFIDLAQDLPGRLDVEQPHNDPGVLPLEIGHRGRRISEERLTRRDLDALALGLGLKVVEGLESRAKVERA